MERLKNIVQDFISPDANTYHWSMGKKLASSLSGFVAGFIAGVIAVWILQNASSDSLDGLR